MSFTRCFSSLGCPALSLDEARALAVSRQIPNIELRALGGTVDLPHYFAAQFGSPTALAARVAPSVPRTIALGASLPLTHATSDEREQLLAWVPWAEALGATWLRVFDGKPTGAGDLDRAAEALAWWRELRRRRGWRVDLMVETHDTLLTAAAIAEFLKAAPGTAILWDSHHTWRKGGEDPFVTWAAIREHVVHVHVKDSVSTPGRGAGYAYVLPGQGEFPFAALMARLRTDGFAGAVSIEWEKMWLPELGPLEDVLATAVTQGW